MKWKFEVTTKGAVIADSKDKAKAIIATAFTYGRPGQFKIGKLTEVKHKIPVGKCPASYPRKG
jgi:hypothetical protein